MIKKIILTTFLFFINITFFTGNIFAAPWDPINPFATPEEAKTWAMEQFWWSWTYIIVTVQEPIPWMNCTISSASLRSWWALEQCTTIDWKTNYNSIWDYNCPASMSYDCYQEKWFGSLKTIIWTFIKFLTYLVWVVWVLYLVINWIMLSMSWLNSGMKENVKKGIVQAILGIIVLFLWGFILRQIAPWVFGV